MSNSKTRKFVAFGNAKVQQACLAALCICLLMIDTAQAASRASSRTGEAHLFRGTGAVFSGGLDVIARRLSKKGMRVKVHVHQSWRSVAKDIIKRSKNRRVSSPIITMGHSAGGRAALSLAKALAAKGLTTKYVVTFDPNTRQSVGARIQNVVNYYIPNAKNSNKLLRGRGFRGRLRNISVSKIPGMSHFNIEKNNRLQNRVIRAALSYTRRR